MSTDHYEIMEYSNEGFGRLDIQFPSIQAAKEWISSSLERACRRGYPSGLSYSVLPVGKPVYETP